MADRKLCIQSFVLRVKLERCLGSQLAERDFNGLYHLTALAVSVDASHS